MLERLLRIVRGCVGRDAQDSDCVKPLSEDRGVRSGW